MKNYIKRLLFIVLSMILCISAFSGCNKASDNYAFFSSYMVNSQDRDVPDDDMIEEKLLPSEALFAYKLERTESNKIQTVYVWHNLLRRELRLDIMQIYDAVPDKDKDVTISVSTDGVIKINNKEIAFEPSSELSFAVLRAIIPAEAKVNAQTFRRIFRAMIIRLETVEYLGETEVIAIETIANTGFYLASTGFYLDNTNSSTEFIREVMSLEDITGKVISQGSSKFPSEPPTLTISDGETTITAWRGTYSWMIEGEDGMGSGITVDSAHPLDYKDSIETINLSQNTKLTLNFESAPTSVSIKRYKLSATDYDAFEKISASYNMIIEAKAGDYLYEVIAKWEDPSKSYSGTAYYAFCTEK